MMSALGGFIASIPARVWGVQRVCPACKGRRRIFVTLVDEADIHHHATDDQHAGGWQKCPACHGTGVYPPRNTQSRTVRGQLDDVPEVAVSSADVAAAYEKVFYGRGNR